jgi:hypothetical protein
MIVIIDNFLSEFNLETTKKQFIGNKTTEWVDTDCDLLYKSDSAFSQILRKAHDLFDLSSMVGCEVWSHYTTKPDWHFDKDENLHEKTGQLKYPICSIVFYPYIQNLIGGRLITGSEQITPRTNRLVLFSPGIYHTVEPFSGERLSVAINPWNYRLVK